MSHSIIAFSLLGGCVVLALPILAYTQKATPPTPLPQEKSLNTITYISTGISGNTKPPIDNIDNIFQSKSFVGSYIPPSTLSNEEKSYDTVSDSSITKYVSRKIPLRDKKYIPNDLITLQSKYLTNSQRNFQLKTEAAEHLITMAQEFQEIFDKKLVLVSAYRSYAYQANLKKNGCSDTLCAPAGQSEHQLGLAVDLFAATTADKFLSKVDFRKYYDRLASNAHRYGFHNTYQKGVRIDTYQVEPRHWRYVGRDLATELYDSKLTFAEWISHEFKINN